MSDKDTWAEFCHKVEKLINENSLEFPYQDKLEDCFSMIGWYVSNGSIIHQHNIPVGSDGKSIIVDFCLKDDNNLIIPIEVKKPGLKITKKEENQIASYVKQLPTSFGLLIGRQIQFYFQDSASSEPTCVYSFDVKKEDINGPSFINLFKRDHFSKQAIEAFCTHEMLKSKANEELNFTLKDSDKTKAILIDYFSNKYGDFKEIKDSINRLNIKIQSPSHSEDVDCKAVGAIKQNSTSYYLQPTTSLSDYFSAVQGKLIKKVLLQMGLPSNIFEIQDKSLVQKIIDKVSEEEDKNYKSKGKYASAVKHYLRYLNEGFSHHEFEHDALLVKQSKSNK